MRELGRLGVQLGSLGLALLLTLAAAQGCTADRVSFTADSAALGTLNDVSGGEERVLDVWVPASGSAWNSDYLADMPVLSRATLLTLDSKARPMTVVSEEDFNDSIGGHSVRVTLARSSGRFRVESVEVLRDLSGPALLEEVLNHGVDIDTLDTVDEASVTGLASTFGWVAGTSESYALLNIESDVATLGMRATRTVPILLTSGTVVQDSAGVPIYQGADIALENLDGRLVDVRLVACGRESYPIALAVRMRDNK